MRQLFLLVRVQLLALLASFRLGGSRKKAASVWAALALAAGLCLYISGVYSFALGGPLAEAGHLELLLVLMPALAAAAGMAFTAFAAQGVVFGGRDGDLLLSLPVGAFTVLLAKLTALYAENLLFCAFLTLPAGAAWLWFGGEGGALFLLRLVIGIPFLTMVPTALSLAAGFLLSWLGGRFANSRAVNLLLYGVLLVAVFAVGMQVNQGVADLAAGAMTGGEVSVPAWAAPFLLFQRGVCGDWETLVMFCLLSLVPVLAEAGLFAGRYRQVLTGLQSRGKRPAYRLGQMKASSQHRALLRKEAARYFGTPIYLFNTGIGLILLAVAGVAAAVMGGSLRAQLAALEGVPLLSLAAAAAAFTLCTVGVTASSVSLEGDSLWVLKTAPVSAGEILGVKAGFQLLLVLPCLAVYTAGISCSLGLSPAETAALGLAGAGFAGASALFGLTVNLLFPKLDAVSDMAVVKQSLAVTLSMFGGMAGAVVCGALVWALTGPIGETAALAVCGGALLGVCVLLGLWLKTGGAKRFRAL